MTVLSRCAEYTYLIQALTSRTTAQIVAELGWTRLIIQKVLGITPTTMRAPYGDLDDRVRAIALAMGMVPIQWTRAPSGFTFDTNGTYDGAPENTAELISTRTRLACCWRKCDRSCPDGYLQLYPQQCNNHEQWVSVAGCFLEYILTFINSFIVLEHDLYEVTVDLAIGYTLPAAMNHNPPFQVRRSLHGTVAN